MTRPAPAPARARRPLLVVLVAVAVVVAGVGFVWLRGLDVFRPVGDQVSIPVAVGSAVVVGVFPGGSRTVELRSVRARVEAGSGAEVRVVLCDGAKDVLGAARGTAAQMCARVVDPTGERLGRVGPGRQLVLEVVPRRPGRVVVNGVQLSYRSGLRFGSEATGERVVVVAS